MYGENQAWSNKLDHGQMEHNGLRSSSEFRRRCWKASKKEMNLRAKNKKKNIYSIKLLMFIRNKMQAPLSEKGQASLFYPENQAAPIADS